MPEEPGTANGQQQDEFHEHWKTTGDDDTKTHTALVPQPSFHDKFNQFKQHQRQEASRQPKEECAQPTGPWARAGNQADDYGQAITHQHRPIKQESQFNEVHTETYSQSKKRARGMKTDFLTQRRGGAAEVNLSPLTSAATRSTRTAQQCDVIYLKTFASINQSSVLDAPGVTIAFHIDIGT